MNGDHFGLLDLRSPLHERGVNGHLVQQNACTAHILFRSFWLDLVHCELLKYDKYFTNEECASLSVHFVSVHVSVHTQ